MNGYPACLGVFGYTKDEIFSLSPKDLSEDPETVDVEIKEVSTGKLTHIPLHWVKKKDGTIFPTEVCTGTFLYKGRRKILGVITALTERKHAEDDLKLAYNLLKEVQDASFNIMEDLKRERSNLERLSIERETLIKEIHHRVRNNMQIVISILRLLFCLSWKWTFMPHELRKSDALPSFGISAAF